MRDLSCGLTLIIASWVNLFCFRKASETRPIVAVLFGDPDPVIFDSSALLFAFLKVRSVLKYSSWMDLRCCRR